MDRRLFVVQGWYEHGDGESGPMVTTWYEIVKAEDVGEAWLKYRNARPATKKEIAGYEEYEREVQRFKEQGIKEEDCPFGVIDFVAFEEEA